MLHRCLLILICAVLLTRIQAQHKESFNNDWEFVKGIDTVFSDELLQKNSAVKWEKITLPHTANIEPIEKVGQQWQGICFYRKFFSVPAGSKGKHIALQFDAAMQQADVYLNGKHIFQHLGGYLPFYIDVSDEIRPGEENSLLVMLDNRDNHLIPPGKPLKDLDFNYYSGIYRNVWLITKNKLHITDPVAADTTAGGGVFLHYENIGARWATLVVQTELKNDLTSREQAQIRLVLRDKAGKTVVQGISKAEPVAGGGFTNITQRLLVPAPHLWSPESPYLYQLSIEVVQNGNTIDDARVRTGIRTLRIEAGAVYLNGKKIKIRGTNRHQDYPYIGNALSDNAQYRDAWKIKQAGFNFVRSCHYPQSPAYLDACDELGLLVMDATPGWQFTGNDTFLNNSFRNIRDMIRRDRNHASIILWEASLNETRMGKDFMEKAHRIVHEELPFEGIYSAGWIDNVYDVFIPARQHARAPDYWKKYAKNKPILLAEYGDWEYYAQNAGFNQKEFKDLKAEERTSRQLRGWGEKRLLQQALNYQEAHNDNLYGPAIGDVNWLMFDYNRGYAADIQSSGIMDIQRLPKFSFYFFQSQVDPVIDGTSPFTRPMLFMANYWQDASDSVVKIYSNCEEVALLLNGKPVGRLSPDADAYSTNLKHPPFTFHLAAFQPGTLTAIGYIHHKKVVEQQRRTPGLPAKIVLRMDESGRGLKAGQNDVAFVYADITDNDGTIIPGAKDIIEYKLSGDAVMVSPDTVAAEAGTATLLIRVGATAGRITVSARIRGEGGKNIKSAELVAPVAGGTRIDGRVAGRVRSGGPVAGKTWSLPLPGDKTIGMPWVPSGSFTMGSPGSEPGRKKDESPQMQVTLTKGYWLGATEVTVGQWKAVTGFSLRGQVMRMLSDDSLYDFGGQRQRLRDFMHFDRNDPDRIMANEDEDLPMYFVSWYDAMAFCQALTKQERAAGRLPAGYIYTLPTEAQWEYACRAGTTDASFAGPLTVQNGATPALDSIAWYAATSKLGYTGRGLGKGPAGPRRAGEKGANAWGLRDMAGNLWEWCRDWYGPYQGGSLTDPTGPATGIGKVDRGGSWGSGANDERSANRASNPPAEKSAYRGFRVALCHVQ